jgi:hypothetical protein
MSFIYINVLFLCVKPAHKKKGSYNKMCLKINFSLNGVFLLNFFYFKNTELKRITRLTKFQFLFNYNVIEYILKIKIF